MAAQSRDAGREGADGWEGRKLPVGQTPESETPGSELGGGVRGVMRTGSRCREDIGVVSLSMMKVKDPVRHVLTSWRPGMPVGGP